MQQLISFPQYCQLRGIKTRALYDQINAGKVICIKQDGERYIIENIPEIMRNPKVKKLISEEKKREFKERIKQIALQVKTQGRHKNTSDSIQCIVDEVTQLNKTGFNIKGFTQRSIQRMIKNVSEYNDGLIRRTRADKFKPRIKLLNEKPEVLEKAIELTAKFYLADPLYNLSNAIDRVRYYCEQHEDLWEVRAINYYTLKRHINVAFQQSGYEAMSDYLNHFNIWRQKLAYTQGAFTHDTGFMEEYQIDDRVSDIAGAWLFNDSTGKFELKKAMHWQVIETTTMMVLGRRMKATPFVEEDLIRMMMDVFDKWGKPKRRIVYDNGLMTSARCEQFFNRVGVVAERAKRYSGQDKAMRERMNRFQKEESDIYNENFIGSNHPVEGRHRSERLSPEQVHELFSETEKRYDVYFNGYYMDRPRKLGSPLFDHLRDNRGKVTIRQAFDELYKTHTKIEVDPSVLAYAYQSQKTIKLNHHYVNFKGNVYLPDAPLPFCLVSESNEYTVAFNPNNLNTIYLYSNQDMQDRETGWFIQRGDRVAIMSSIMMLEADEKKRRVLMYNKQIKKKQAEYARAIGDKLRLGKDMIDVSVNSDGELYDDRKQREKRVQEILRTSLPVDKILIEVEKKEAVQSISMDEAFSDDCIKTLDEIKLD